MNFNAFTVLPAAPPKLEPLVEMAYNMWFSWNYEASRLFKRLDWEYWLRSSQNPVRMLCLIPQEKLEEASKDAEFLKEMENVYTLFKYYMDGETWFGKRHGKREKPLVAYFSCEFGMHESLPIYSGGLGVLAGDHLKSASDLGLPLVGIGLLYRQGYFKQYLNLEGMQQEEYPENDWYSLPVKLVKNGNGEPLFLNIIMGDQTVHFQVWNVAVGRINLLLLDTNLPQNPEPIRQITKRLYDSDREIRIQQEILLGIGGIHTLKMMDILPPVFHCNEGHSAFLILERIRLLQEDNKLSLAEARQVAWASNVFTTHTPVPAGNERFEIPLIEKYFKGYAKALNLEWDDFLALGREDPENQEEPFCMTVLALKLSAFCNGVSQLHGQISRRMWRGLYPKIMEKEIPIEDITNGVHIRSWLSPHMAQLMFRYRDSRLLNESSEFGEEIYKIPDKDVWAISCERREILVSYVRERVKQAISRRGGNPREISIADKVLNPEALTIGFARRFATYKRGDLFLQDPERLKKLLTNDKHPVQIVLAGKAHPADFAGKEIIKRIYNFAKHENLQDRIVFLENYDIDVARHLVQGVDIWLNNPRRPMEASGTSGMKAALNGCLNLSVQDGWWEEGFHSDVGWSIGFGESYEDMTYQDEIEGNVLYRLLEEEIIPLFYNRDTKGVPVEWVRMMKNSIHKLGTEFNSHRMVMQYTDNYYVKADEAHKKLDADNYKGGKELARWQEKVSTHWDDIQIESVSSNVKEIMYAGDELEVEADINLGPFKPENLRIEVFHGALDNQGNIEKGYRTPMELTGSEGSRSHFKTKIPCQRGGRYGYAVRVLPGHPMLAVSFLPGYIHWAT